MDSILSNLISAMMAVSFIFITVVGYRLSVFIHHRFHHDSSQALYSMFLFVSPSKILLSSLLLALFFGSITAWLTQSWFIIIPILIASLFVPGLIIRRFLQTRTRNIVRQLPDTIESIALSMKAGMNFMNAFEMVVKEEKPPISQEFSLLLKEVKMGTSFDQALYNLEKRIPVDAIKYMVSGVLISREVGGNLAEMLMSLSKTMRRISEVEQKVAALTAQGKMQGKIMTALPGFLSLGLYALEPKAMSYLWSSPVGWCVLAATLVMLTMGYFAINKIVDIQI